MKLEVRGAVGEVRLTLAQGPPLPARRRRSRAGFEFRPLGGPGHAFRSEPSQRRGGPCRAAAERRGGQTGNDRSRTAHREPSGQGDLSGLGRFRFAMRLRSATSHIPGWPEMSARASAMHPGRLRRSTHLVRGAARKVFPSTPGWTNASPQTHSGERSKRCLRSAASEGSSKCVRRLKLEEW